MADPITFPDHKFVVLHGHTEAGVQLLEYEPPTSIWTAQPNIEPFDDPQSAIDRAIALGVPPEATATFWPTGQHLDAQHRLVDDPSYDPAPAPPEPVEVRLEKLEKRLGALEAR